MRRTRGVRRIFRIFARLLFFPAFITRPRFLALPIILLLSLVFALTVVASFPMIRELTAEHVLGFKCLAIDTKESGKAYCDFLGILSQVLIAAIVGGVATTQGLTSYIESWADRQQKRNLIFLDQAQAAIKAKLIDAYRQVLAMMDRYMQKGGSTFLNPIILVVNLVAFFITLWQLLKIEAGFLPKLLWRVLASFPGGFYGMITFLFFEGFLLAQTVKAYYDYTPPCP